MFSAKKNSSDKFFEFFSIYRFKFIFELSKLFLKNFYVFQLFLCFLFLDWHETFIVPRVLILYLFMVILFFWKILGITEYTIVINFFFQFQNFIFRSTIFFLKIYLNKLFLMFWNLQLKFLIFLKFVKNFFINIL